jgi:hypothetical protein
VKYEILRICVTGKGARIIDATIHTSQPEKLPTRLANVCLNDSGIPMDKSVALNDIYIRQIEKIKKAISTLHEDLQFDYSEELEALL